jgi:hypothetical protein
MKFCASSSTESVRALESKKEITSCEGFLPHQDSLRAEFVPEPYGKTESDDEVVM